MKRKRTSSRALGFSGSTGAAAAAAPPCLDGLRLRPRRSLQWPGVGSACRGCNALLHPGRGQRIKHRAELHASS